LKTRVLTSFPPCLQLIILFQIVTDIVVLADIPTARQVIGFIYLTFIPGYALLNALGFRTKNAVETLLFSLGLDVAALMFTGLLIDVLLPVAGLTSPLSTIPLLFALNIVVLCSSVWIYLRKGNSTFREVGLPKRYLLLIIVPFLSVLGALTVTIWGNNLILLVMLASVAGLAVLTTVYHRKLSTPFLGLVIFAAGIALLLHTSLVTNYLVGYDINSEFHAFQLTDSSSSWISKFSSPDIRISNGYSMLSVTIFPVVYSKVGALDGTLLFKVLYPLILGFVPLALYQIYCSKIGKIEAFLAVFLILSNLTFFDTEGFPTKQMIAELFFVLLVLVVLKDDISSVHRIILVLVFGAGLAVSHYATSYILLFFLLVPWLFFMISRYTVFNMNKSSRISLSLILILFVMTFSWYIYTSASAPFEALVDFGNVISKNLITDFFNPSARTTTVLMGLGIGGAASFAHEVGRIFFYLSEFLIVVGVLSTLLKKEFARLGSDYMSFSILSLAILIFCIVVPNFARFFRVERFYQISLLFLAPFFVFGAKAICEFFGAHTRLLKAHKETLTLILVLIAVVPLFFFETGFIYETTGDFSYSVPLSMYRMDKISLFNRITDAQEVTAAMWLSSWQDPVNNLVYADYVSLSNVLTSYGMMSGQNLRVLSNKTDFVSDADYIYLRGVNTEQGVIVGQDQTFNLSDIQSVLENQCLIYSNQESIVFWMNTNHSVSASP
jgi:uncharacterized membrane protein